MLKSEDLSSSMHWTLGTLLIEKHGPITHVITVGEGQSRQIGCAGGGCSGHVCEDVTC